MALPRALHAQAAIRLSALEISLWPEYDQEGVLVIYRGTLASDIKLPVRIEFLIPAAAGKPSSTAGVDDAGEFHYRQYTVEPAGDSLRVSFLNPYRAFQLEFYHNPLVITGSQRSFAQVVTTDYAADGVTLEVQEPAGAEGFQMTPAPTETTTDSDGLSLHRVSLGRLEAGSVFTAQVSYVKTDARTSAAILKRPTPSQARFEDAPAAGGTSPVVYVLLGVGLAALVSAIVLSAMRSRSRRTHPASVPSGQAMRGQARRDRRLPQAKPGARQSSDARYCRKCGAALRDPAQFCAKCGTKARG